MKAFIEGERERERERESANASFGDVLPVCISVLLPREVRRPPLAFQVRHPAVCSTSNETNEDAENMR